MKNVIFSVALLLLIIIGCIASLYYTRITTDNMLNALDICENAVKNENWELASDSIQRANSLWDNYRPLYSTFLRHNELTQVTSGLSRIIVLISLHNRDDFLAENRSLRELIEFIATFDEPTFENLF